MYQLEWVHQFSRGFRRRAAAPAGPAAAPGSIAVEQTEARPRVSPTVWYLGFTSCLTDISSEMVNGILPLYVVGFLRLTPLQFGVIDGLYQGVSAVLRLAGGVLADRWHRHKEAAAAGYALSAVCKLGLLVTGASWPALASVIALDRTGKGLRTAPRDALITLSSPRTALAASFGVHRALDAAGALIGPIVAFLILAQAPNAFDVVFVTSFSFAIVGLSILLLFVKPLGRTPAVASPAVAAPAPWPGVKVLFDRSAFGYLVLAASALSLATVSDAFIYLALQERLAFSSGVFPLLYVATSLVYMATAVPAGRLADRIGRRTVFVGGYLIMGGVYALLLFPSTGFIGATLAIVGLGAYYAATEGVLMALAGRLLAPAVCATGLAVLTTCTSLARLFSSVLFGSLWTAGDVSAAIGVFGAALAVALVIAIVALSRVEND